MRAVGPVLYAYWFIFRPRTSGSKVVLVRNGNLFLVRHSYGPRTWQLPGGHREQGETYEQTAIREVQEELGVRVSRVQHCGECYFTHQYKRDTVHVYGASPLSEPVVDGVEILEGAWFPQDAVPKVGLATRAMLDKFFAAHYTY